MMALDEFVFWVNSKTPYKTPQEYLAAVKKAGGKMKMGGTGSKQEDQIITAAIEQKTGVKFTYVPYKGGGTVATQLVGGHINSTVNNPIEQVAHWRAGSTRPLCVFDGQAHALSGQDHQDHVLARHPDLQVAGASTSNTLMLRGIMTTPGVSQDVVDYYVDVLKKVRATPEWKAFMEKGAFNQSFMTGV